MSEVLAGKLRAARQSAHLTQAQIAQALGVTRGAVTQWEAKGAQTRTTPSLETLREFAIRTCVPLDWLINDQLSAQDAERVRQQFLLSRQAGGNPTHEQPRTPPPEANALTRASTSRMAQAFWRAVEFEACQLEPQLEHCFEIPVSRGTVLLHADFFDGQLLVTFDALPLGGDTQANIKRKLADMLLIERVHGSPLRKALLLWVPNALQVGMPGEIEEMGAVAGVTIKRFFQPQAAAQYLVGLTKS